MAPLSDTVLGHLKRGNIGSRCEVVILEDVVDVRVEVFVHFYHRVFGVGFWLLQSHNRLVFGAVNASPNGGHIVVKRWFGHGLHVIDHNSLCLLVSALGSNEVTLTLVGLDNHLQRLGEVLCDFVNVL